MKYYVFAEIQITDPSWVGPYAENVTRMVERHGGRYLARTPKIEKLEGDRPAPQVCLLIEWPSREVAMAFYLSDAYRPYLESRAAGSMSELSLIAGEDVTGAAQIVE
ncbi:MAG TPA: DUF1330 domain-containing protein [Longimicrobium sp.]|nr:DUF1330 domain-containing protein [Longimicrobium sp.]